MTAPTIHCPLCEWTYTVPSLPAGVDETALAGVFGPGVMLLSAINRRAAETERQLLEHLDSHPLPEWLRKVTALQAEIELLNAELAMLREREGT